MMMLPPVVVSLPFKLIFFVLVDGWSLVAGSLVQSYGGIAADLRPLQAKDDQEQRVKRLAATASGRELMDFQGEGIAIFLPEGNIMSARFQHVTSGPYRSLYR